VAREGGETCQVGLQDRHEVIAVTHQRPSFKRRSEEQVAKFVDDKWWHQVVSNPLQAIVGVLLQQLDTLATRPDPLIGELDNHKHEQPRELPHSVRHHAAHKPNATSGHHRQ